MAQFRYSAHDPKSNKKQSGVLEAGNRHAALEALKKRGWAPYILEAAKSREAAQHRFSLKTLFQRKTYSKGSSKQITLDFLSKLLQLHKSGLPVGDAVRTLRDRLQDIAQRELAKALWQDLSEGKTMAEAFSKRPEYFGPSICYALEAGEVSGNLVPILENIVEHLKTQAQLKKQIAAGLAYPVFISVVALSVVFLFLFYLLPRIQGMMESLGGNMSLSAQILIGSVAIAMRVGPVLLVVLIVGVLWIGRFRKTVKGKRLTDAWLLHIPIVKTVISQSTFAQTANLLETLLKSGVTTTEALFLAEKLIANTLMLVRFQEARKKINDGLPLTTAFRQTGFFPDLALDILSVGENTGDMARSFGEISGIYNAQLTANLKKMTTAISSIALIFAFSLVSILALSIVTSVLQFSNSLVR